MAAQPMFGGEFKLDSTSGGSLAAYSSYVRSITINLPQNAAQHHTIDSRNPKTSRGGLMGDMTITYVIDPDAASLGSVLEAWATGASNVTRTFQFGKPDISTTGSRLYTGECQLQNPSPVVTADAEGSGPATATATFLLEGVTISTVA
jgi:hypothetical protein